MKEDPIIMKEEPITNKEGPKVMKEEPIVIKEESIINKEDPVINKEVPSTIKEEPIVIESGSEDEESGNDGFDMESYCDEVTEVDDFKTEYAPSGRAKCRSCFELIGDVEVRISKKDRNHWANNYWNIVFEHYHINCFDRDRMEIGFHFDAKFIPGIESLDKFHQRILKDELLLDDVILEDDTFDSDEDESWSDLCEEDDIAVAYDGA